MIPGGFFINSYKLVRAYWHGLKADEELRILLVILVTLLSSATVFYWRVEGWSPVDALYFSVMTMSTIGHDGFVPTTTLSKLFTIIFLFLSIGIYIAVLAKIVKVILSEKKVSMALKKNKKEQKKQQAVEEVNVQSKSHYPESTHSSGKENMPE
jgi:voltage-gated potassium channel Kch